MFDTASGRLITSLDANPMTVSLVQVAVSLPLFLFTLPSGALADVIDSRRLLIAVEGAILAVSVIFAALEMLSSQSVIDAKRPGLGVGEGAVYPGQDDVGGHGADDVGLMPDVGGTGVGRPTVGFDRGARCDVGGDEACSETAEKSLIAARRRRPGASFSTSTAPATNILPWGERPPPPQTGSASVRNGISASSTSMRPASGARPGATMARRSLAHSSHADL